MHRKSVLAPNRPRVRYIIWDTILIVACLYASLFLRVGAEQWNEHVDRLHLWLPAILGIRLICLYGFRTYSVMYRYISTLDAIQVVKAMAVSTTLIIVATFFVPEQFFRLPRSVYIIDALLLTSALMGVRLLSRFHYEARAEKTTRGGKRTLIFGAGEQGRLLAHRYRSDAHLDTKVVGFIDDDQKKWRMNISGVPVLGGRESLHAAIVEHGASQVIIAVRDLPGERLREIFQITRPFNIRPRITGSLANDNSQKKFVEVNRDIDLADLLNRPRRELDNSSVRKLVRGKRVLVTGAGGSIGSEIARQIMGNEPGRLLLLDHSEYNLYEIDKELRLSTHDTQRVVPLMIDLKDEHSLRVAMKEYAPEVVFHAAAYKHVHLVESNPFSSILNNVYGTQILLDCCKEINVTTFVMISTDKAVNPAGVMGATKRVCELLVTGAAVETGQRYCSVRFGNVLGSSGSLIPLLKKQIHDGGPVTITHQEMTRFFMLVPEAVSLVLKAATIANPGDINVLKMGEPVKILDIAKSLIALMGRADDEIPIVFTGLRPGEKMFEELYIRGDELNTEHPDILTLPDGDSNLTASREELTKLYQQVNALIKAALVGEKQALFELNNLVKSNYTPDLSEIKDSGIMYSIESHQRH